MSAARIVALVVAVAAGAVGIARGTWAVGGSDSSCYALMAQAFARGQWQPTAPLATAAPWPNAAMTFAPGGFIPSPMRADAASPVCAPGFSLLLAPLYVAAGPDAIFLLVPLSGALLVYATFALGARLAGEVVGLAAAVVVASGPVFIFQVVQPMNDVLVAMLWVSILVLATSGQDRALTLGALTGAALLVRPNLAPAAGVIALWVLRGGPKPALRFAAAAMPFILLCLWLNAVLYGHPLRTGYGAAADLFAFSYFTDNVRHYWRALWQTQLAFPLIGVAAAAVAPRERRSAVLLSLTLACSLAVVYLFYRPLPEWWYLRFLLPAATVLTVLALAAISFATRRQIAAIPAAALVVWYGVTSPAMDEALALWRVERRFRVAADVVRERLPHTAVLITVWESGSMRYHAEREAVLWDSLEPGRLPSAIAWLESRGRAPYLVLEDWEEPLFRQRFGALSDLGQLDWPPRFEIERRVRVYDPADRARYWRGENIPTEYVVVDRR